MNPQLLLKYVLISMWFSLLFLPFKGLRASLTFFLAFLFSVILITYLLKYGMQWKDKFGAVANNINRLRASAPSSNWARYMVFSIFLVIPFFTKDYFLDVAILACIYIILALGLNVVVGFTGLLNLGFVAFYAVGAYTYALLNIKLGLGFWQSLPISLVLTTISGLILAIPSLRLKGDYLAIVTLGFGEITRLVLNNWDSLTGGPNGISGISSPSLLGISLGRLNRFYYLTLISVVLAYVIVRRIRLSRIGRAWIAIREDELGASSMGINTTRYKLYSFAFGSFWAGFAGSLFAAKMQFISPESFTFMESVLILCMVILGGIGSIGGVMAGAVILVILPEVLREIQSYRMLVLGAGIIVMMIFRPQGIFGSSHKATRHFG